MSLPLDVLILNAGIVEPFILEPFSLEDPGKP
jgi:hypothetical protein